MQITLLLLALGLLIGCKGMRSAPPPAYTNDYAVFIDGKPIEVHSCRVSAMPFNRVWPGKQRPLEQTELASFASFPLAKPVTVEVHLNRPFKAIAIRPSARSIQHVTHGNRITFQLDRPGQFTFEADGFHHALHLFADPSEPPPPDPRDPNVITFPAGIHHPGPITLKDNQTVYLAAGAIVHTSIQATGAKNIRITGRGILDTSTFPREHKTASGNIRLLDCHNVTIEGIILRDPNVWSLTTLNCSNVRIRNVKLVGLWRYNADGIDICNSQDVVIEDCFIRSFDDSIAIKGLDHGDGKDPQPCRNILAERCVIWNDWGRALEIGAETVAPEISDITFRDCDIIRTNSVALDIQHGDRAAVKNIRYENIRWEIDDVHEAPVMQETDDQRYVPQANWVPRLLVIEITHNMWNKDPVRGTVDNVFLRNIEILGKHRAPPHRSRITGFDADHMVRNVTIENLRVNGRPVENLDAANVTVQPFVENVRIIPPSAQTGSHPPASGTNTGTTRAK